MDVHGVSTRSAFDLVKAMSAGGMFKRRVSRLRADIDARVMSPPPELRRERR